MLEVLVGSTYGAPCWVSLMTHDMAATQEFYGSVLGWAYEPGSLGPDFRTAVQDGLPVAGLGELAAKWQLPHAWNVYFQVEDADVAADRIRERVATMAVGPVRLGQGRAAMAADPAGASFGLWQGEGLENWSVGEGRAPVWLELRTRDAFASALFYGEVFDWAADSSTCEVVYEEGENEVFVLVRGQTIAGLLGGGVEAAADPQVRPRWHVYFRVPDVERAATAATEAGGRVLSPPQPMFLGTTATLRDPQGALFSVLSMS